MKIEDLELGQLAEQGWEFGWVKQCIHGNLYYDLTNHPTRQEIQAAVTVTDLWEVDIRDCCG